MRLLVDDGGSARAVTLSITSEGATVADLAASLGLGTGHALLIDGVRYPSSTDLTEVAFVDGSRIVPAGEPDGVVNDAVAVWVGVVSGPGAGTLFRTHAGCSITIGRAQTNDLTIDNTSVSACHSRLNVARSGQVEVEDLGSRNGTRVDGDPISQPTHLTASQIVRLGSSSIRTVTVDPKERSVGASNGHADDGGHILFNRPPRAPVPEGARPVAVPQVGDTEANPRLAVVSLLAPLVLAGVMVVALGSWRYALFGLFSPLMALGNWFSSRRRVGKERTRAGRREQEEFERFGLELEAAVVAERLRRRDFAPDLIEVRKRIELPTPQLWERRPDATDAFVFRLGVGETLWDVPLVRSGGIDSPGTAEAVSKARRLVDAEILVDLRNGHLGIVGDQSAGTGLLSSAVLQLATHHGPADLQVVVFTSADRVDLWRSTQWLPHSSQLESGAPRVLCGEDAQAFANALLEEVSGEVPPSWLVVLDDATLVRGRGSAIRKLLAERSSVFALVMAATMDELPSSVTVVVDATSSDDGEFTMWSPQLPGHTSSGILDLLSEEDARSLFCSMARFHDPELIADTGALPSQVSGRQVHDEWVDPAAVASKWALGRDARGLATAIGVGPSGRVNLDLVADGPHALVAGTTGSGKSEFLRSLVAGLALENGPDRVVFVLIDYKGGSAFDRCADLPHVVGVVTDLDDHLAQRALQSLEAELHHRERLLRAADVSDVAGYHRAGSPGGQLPRLVVVIDEFATLRAELPEFVASLVSIAQRGRSLGVHLVLATQRPSGAVDANIRANTNLRVALRVQSAADSTDVVDSAVAATIPRGLPGRAFVRRGERDLVAVQTAFLSGPAERGGSPFRIESMLKIDGAIEHDRDPAPPDQGPEVSELDEIVAAVAEAATGLPAPRRPWLDDLPVHVLPEDVAHLADSGQVDRGVVPFLVGDDPNKQRRVLRGWSPSIGHLAVVGVRGSGVSTALMSVVAELGHGLELDTGERSAPWVFVADHAGSALAATQTWPHVGCTLEATDVARHRRLMTVLESEFDRRRRLLPGEVDAEPQIVVVVDGVSGFFETLDAEPGSPMSDLLSRLGRDGPSMRISFVVGAERPGDIPRMMRSQIRDTLVLEQSSLNEFSAVGVSTKNLPRFVPGRGLFGADHMVCQVIDHGSSFDPANVSIEVPPPEIHELPTSLNFDGLSDAVVGDDLAVPIGREVATHAEASLVVRSGDHVLVAGPAGSGRTTTLRSIARKVRDVDTGVVLVGVVPAAGSLKLLDSDVLDAGGSIDEIEHVLRMAMSDERRWIVFVDDADRIDGEGGPLADLARASHPNVTLIVAMRTSAGRSDYGHWTRHIRRSGVGVLLSPDNTLDGELLGVRLPRNQRVEPHPGRGYLVGAQGSTEVHVAECGTNDPNNA